MSQIEQLASAFAALAGYLGRRRRYLTAARAIIDAAQQSSRLSELALARDQGMEAVMCAFVAADGPRRHIAEAWRAYNQSREVGPPRETARDYRHLQGTLRRCVGRKAASAAPVAAQGVSMVAQALALIIHEAR
jgi:hypothetical protein